jgi:hypothetical protein
MNKHLLIKILFILSFSISAYSETPSELVLGLADQVLAGQVQLDSQIQLNDYKEQEKKFDEMFMIDPEFQNQAKEKAIEIATQYLQNNRPQEAIWTLAKGHQFELSSLLEQKIRKAMMEMPLVITEQSGGSGRAKGVTGAIRGTIGGIPALPSLGI